MKNQGRTGNLTRFVVWAALNVVLLIGCGGGGGGPGPVSGPMPMPVPPDSLSPTVVSTDPADGATDVAIDASLKITFTEPVTNVTEATFLLTADGVPVPGKVAVNGAMAMFTPSAPLAPPPYYGYYFLGVSVYQATITTGVTDLSGNHLATEHTWAFTTNPNFDTTPPVVTTTNPAEGSSGVPVGTFIIATFSERVTNVTETTFLLTADGAPVPGKVTVNGWSAFFTPSAPLPTGASCTAMVTTGVRDFAGNPLATDCTWTFTTNQASDTTPPTVSSTTPVEGATGVPVGTSVTASFTEPVTNLSEATFLLTGDGAPVSGKVTLNGPTATFTPSTPLSVGPMYRATITTGVKDLSGNALATDYSWSFTLSSSPWLTPVLFETGSDNAFSPKIAMDGRGQSIVVWVQSDGTANSIWARGYRYAILGSAEPAALTLIETGAGQASSPQVAMDNSGNGVVVWVQSDGTADSIWSNRYAPGTGWGTATLVETGEGIASSPQVAMDNSGNATAVWVQSDGADSIWANRYVPGTGWGTATLVETGAGQASSPQVAMDNSGNATAVWVQPDGTADSVWSNRYAPGTGWETATFVETGEGKASSPQVAMNGGGNSVVVWVQPDGTADSIWSNRYVPGTGWGTATLVETGEGKASSPQVAMNSGDNAVAVWVQPDGTADSIWSSRYVSGTGWGTPTLLEAGPGNASSPQVAMDGGGNAVAVWVQSDGAFSSIWSNRYTPSSGWGTASPIEVRSGQASSPHVAIMNHYAVAVWEEWDGTRRNIRLSQNPMPYYGPGCSIAGTGGGWKEGVSAYGVLILVAAGLAVRRFHRRLRMVVGDCE